MSKTKSKSLPILESNFNKFQEDAARILASSSLKPLIKYIQPMCLDTKCSKILDEFINDPNLYVIPIVDDGNIPVGIITRSKILELFSRPYTRELFGRKQIIEFMDSPLVDIEPIIMEQEKDIDDVARIIADSRSHSIADGFIITCKGFYVGMGSGRDLLNAITEQKNAHLYQLAHFDALTRLPSRMLFHDRLVQACNRIVRKNEGLEPPRVFLGLLFLDLDRFKIVNDTLGHDAGDLLLKEVSQRLLACVRTEDTVSRLGGDEFTVILSQIKTTRDAAYVSEKIINSIGKPFYLHKHEVFVGVSIGIALFPIDDTNIDNLIKKADMALYHAKDNGRNHYQFFTEEMNCNISKRLALEKDLRNAIKNNEFFLVFQPIINLHTGGIDGVEALIRWKHNDIEIKPTDFIPLAEDIGLIVPIGEWVLYTACKQGSIWKDAGYEPINIAVNLSIRQLRQENFIERVEKILKKTGFDPHWLEFELTESLLMKNVEESIVVLEKLKKLGIKLSIDDFGTGYSSLSYLQHLPIDTLKMDLSFVQGIDTPGNNTNIIRAIIGLGHGLDLTLIAEGVETQAQLDFLCQQNCDKIQGYFCSHPITAEVLEKTVFLSN